MNRREFIQGTGALALAATLSPLPAAQTQGPSAAKLPRWRGFNLLEKFSTPAGGSGARPFQEADFQIMREWGFDFARLPMSYWSWSDPKDWLNIREDQIKEVDGAVEFGRQYGVHVNLNLHRAPGYCVNPPKERLDLWKDEEALEACAFHWAHFARRYKGIPNSRVSFDLLNEPAHVSEVGYVRVVTRLVEAIRKEDPNRLIIADGLDYGRTPVHGLASLGLGQSTRGYDPFPLTHWKASWVNGSDKWPEPAWPFRENPKTKDDLRRERIEPWKALEAKGVGVHVGEWGVFNQTPHPVALAWMRDVLSLWKEAGWGWSLWNLRGSFGVLHSDRRDVEYETFKGRRLDREMLELLRQF
jgi:endoglucanase